MSVSEVPRPLNMALRDHGFIALTVRAEVS